MREVVQIAELERARVALNPIRIRLLRELTQPQTCAELARTLSLGQQRVHNHLKELLRVGLIRIARRRRVRNLIEATYEAIGKAYWLSPRLLRDDTSERQHRDELSLHNLLVTAEAMQRDVADLLDTTGQREVPSLGLTVEVALRDDDERQRFTKDVLDALSPVIERYQGPANPDNTFTLTIVSYPKPNPRSTP